ncbi:RagB/SusD family nutrient uptake outer membrane protein [Aestuariibaculum suncheonense]|uniref:RagB/SusD family nutrient uptake outer membrane protein n=1 Tax=Aestuariibaculum suncheonense TaxID=1028745 RepID=A0A8J6UAY4_9FLAO|nr:RagB/SusD family nutrient uptake outer membrane protein [Aestuariibaculum suncheonense]MBD0835380.1 RagB/SusD family nutrient uptake outer membrane protein [Aestuariibaculum suncheonense]
MKIQNKYIATKKLTRLINTIFCLLVITVTVSCDNDFLNELPQDKYTEQTAFRSYDNFKTYAWSLYSIFSSDNHLQRINNAGDTYVGDVEANYLYRPNGRNRWAWQTVTVENAPGGWDYSYIRTVNVMLDNIDNSSMTEGEKEHWRSVGLFFRSYHYMELLSRFGDVPWVENVITEDQTDIIWGPRDSRDLVASNILRDLKYAEEHIKIDGDGNNTINQDCVRALLSRFGLREGTWRKYHGLQDENTYLQAAERVSKLLIDNYPTLGDNFQHRWSTEDLSTYPGTILYKEYATNVIMQPFSRHERGGGQVVEMHARTLERYLCADGKPIATSNVYDGDATIYDEFRNRDLRLLYRVFPPYKVNRINGNNVDWEYTDNPQDREYIDLMNNLDTTGDRPFPLLTWQPFTIDRMPHIKGSANSLAPMSNFCGYYMNMFYNVSTNVTGGARFSTTDSPIFHIEEVLLNYAEIMFELGKFNQSVADVTINKLRPRAGIANMTVSDISDSFDPNRDQTVPAILWEIRRERMVELMGEGFGFDDIRRWKKADFYINQQPLGVRIPREGNPTSLKWIETGEDAGRCYRIDDVLHLGLGWKEHYYLYPIPLKQRTLNPNLNQNPLWE